MRLNIGSDYFRIENFINVDIRPSVNPDLVMNIGRLGFKDCSVSEILLGNVLEHLEITWIYKSLEECRRILKNDGVLYVTIPLSDRAQKYLDAGQIDKDTYNRIVKGEPEGYNSHKTWFVEGDLEIILRQCEFSFEPLDLFSFPYLIVSDSLNPRPDPWQYGVKATIS